MTHHRSQLLLLSALLLITLQCPLASGCASAARPSDSQAAGVEGRFTLEVTVHRGAGSVARFLVSEDGMLSYAGGENARDRTFTWSGELPDSQLAHLRELLHTHGWMNGMPDPAGVSEDATAPTRIDVSIRGSTMRQRFTIRGTNDGADEIVTLLEDAARSRHDDFLDSLPQPGSRQNSGR